MERLRNLSSVATELHDVLRAPHLGDCEPGLSDGTSLIVDRPLRSDEIRDLVRSGYQYAGLRRAVFVLGLLGHGFTPGNSSTLYFMGKESQEEVRDGAVNVNDLLITAVEQPGVRGVIGLLDMCHAGGAMPTAHDLAAGVRGGRGRLSVLMASAVQQTAQGLRFSRTLSRVLKDGLDREVPVVDVGSAGRAMRPILGQDVVIGEHDGDQSADRPLWLAWNARGRGTAPGGGLVGRRAREGVGAALAGLSSEDDSRQDWRVPADLREALALRDALLSSARHDVARHRGLDQVTALITAVTSVEFIRSWLGPDLTTGRLRRAFGLLLGSERHVPESSPDLSDRDLLDYLAFERPAGEDCRRWVTRFVVLLAHETGKDVDDPALLRWAERIDAQTLLNDAKDFARDSSGQRRLSLVVSLHSSLAGDWPETLDCWLLRDGALFQRKQFRCATRGQPGVEDALDDAVIWADDEATALDFRLRRVDVALPVGLLLKWRPEEAGVGEALGVRYDVVLHWSGRLAPTRLLKRLQSGVRDRWQAVATCTAGAPVDWVGAEESLQPQELQRALQHGRYPRGIGLAHHPGTREQLMEMLLGYTPVLVWPHQDTGRRAQWQRDLDRYWLSMPTSILQAYQRGWQGEDTDAIADLRVVWDSGEWLDFCRRLSLSGQAADSPTEDT